LIAGQPLHPMKPRPMNPRLMNPKSVPSKSMPANHAAPTQPVHLNPNLHRILNRLMKKRPQPQPQPQPSNVPFSSEPATVPTSAVSTPSRPPVVGPVQKEIKGADNDSQCPICQSSPLHSAKNCPAVVRLDPRRYVDRSTTLIRPL